MPEQLGYRDYVEDDSHMKYYREYQERYARTIRESDRKLLALVSSEVSRPTVTSLLDMGCSTGNLLLHLKAAAPRLRLHGADIVSSIIDDNRKNPALSGVEFHQLDMLQIGAAGEPGHPGLHDIVVCNASLMFFDGREFEMAVEKISGLTRAGGAVIMFDLFHPFDSELMVVETSRTHPAGLRFFQRGYPAVQKALAAAGLIKEKLEPWHMPFDLPRPSDPADLTSYTVRTDAGERLAFRGPLFQSWSHLVARKP
jgi:SAM-dependent methyltransferase